MVLKDQPARIKPHQTASESVTMITNTDKIHWNIYLRRDDFAIIICPKYTGLTLDTHE